MLQPIPLRGADLLFAPEFLSRAEADDAFAMLHAELPWSVHRIRLFGREVDSPRLSAWIGDADAVYTYSRTRFVPLPWTPVLLRLRDRIAAATGADYDSVLANLYRDGRDSMGWHSDDEPELGARPVIASLSLGEVRRFAMKPREGGARPALHHREDESKPHGPPRTLSLALPHGSLLVMRGDTQRNYRHALPRTARPVGPRINLTFRRVVAQKGGC